MWLQTGKTRSQNAGAFMVGSARTIQINGGRMTAVELRESFVQIRNATKMQILFF
jgi:hypothetical protein